MAEHVEAVIFDMDGVLIDSEHLWRKAMKKAFAGVGMPLSEAQCRKTMGLRINEVIAYWRKVLDKNNVDPVLLEESIISGLLKLIDKEGKVIEGIPQLIKYCKAAGVKIGVATSSSEVIMRAVLQKLKLGEAVDAAVSAERLTYGKPHPKVFLVCAKKLRVPHKNCLVIEDSVNGMIAGKAAQMKVVVVPEKQEEMPLFSIADHRCVDMHEVLDVFKKLLPVSR